MGKLGIDIILALKGTPESNPAEWTDSLKWAAGSGVEEAMRAVLMENGVVSKEYVKEKIEMERNGVPIRGEMDMRSTKSTLEMFEPMLPGYLINFEEGEPIEIKSVNNKNAMDVAKYAAGNPRDNYVGQLAIYMDFAGAKRGHLFVATIDGLHVFWFECHKKAEGIYQCGNTIVDLNKEYERFAKLWAIKDGEVPLELWNEEKYKLPVEQIDWTQQTKNAITEARMNRKVIGSKDSWRILYSPWCDKIVEMQGVQRGYDASELQVIHQKTKNYTSKDKKVDTGI